MGSKLPYDTLNEVRQRMSAIAPNLTRYGTVEEANYFKQAAQLSEKAAGATKMEEAPIDFPLKQLEDYYMTDVISRASPTMAKCIQAVRRQRESNY